jgi:Holliday junction resolvase-like predicted endonuclease
MNPETERRTLLSLLNLTKDAPASISALKKECRMPESILKTVLEGLKVEELVQLRGDQIEASTIQRIQIALKILALGGDFEEVARSLGWLEFENIVALTFEENGYVVKRHLRFSSQGRRWEIDLLALRKPLLVLVECKHWLHGLGASSVKKTVEEHLSKTWAFVDELPRLRREIDLSGWPHATAIPILVSLTQSPFRFYEKVPVVAVLQLPSFLSDLPGYMTTLANIRVNLPPEKKIEDYLP